MAPSELPLPKRYFTTHNEETGKAVFSDAVDPEVQADHNFTGFKMYNVYTTSTFPADLNNEADIAGYAPDHPAMPTLDKEVGNVYRVFDVLPGFGPIMTRIASVGVYIVLDGEVECILDSGETQILRKGDVVVQRATMHAWRNTSETEMARVFLVLSPIKPLIVGGRQLGPFYPMVEIYSEKRMKKAGVVRPGL
ncbi:hypothetical protein B0T17DRAFT_323647 [Bombardia bombarda]|uniref:Uncharacterized protein n=1 Tax=Bombardia bombarda TaxID=252184 RepID=A0AA39WMJ1_9PEZI|nr:hypothetical protein B0T17DRAFT_323647 [Bombardia bombarda]